MARRFRWNKRRSGWLWLILMTAIVGSSWSAMSAVQVRRSSRPVNSIAWTPVRRADLNAKILVGGDLKAINETAIKCEVEDISDTDGTLIVSMADNGKIVKKGEELCRLDSSMLEELAQQEEIAVAQARSTFTQASLAVEVARITLREYREGLVVKSTKDFEIRITLAKADAAAAPPAAG